MLTLTYLCRQLQKFLVYGTMIAKNWVGQLLESGRSKRGILLSLLSRANPNESRGRKATGLKSYGAMVAGLPVAAALAFVCRKPGVRNRKPGFLLIPLPEDASLTLDSFTEPGGGMR